MWSGEGRGAAAHGLRLPLSRVKTIMKSSPDVDFVRQEPLVLVAKVTELFIADMARRAYEESKAPILEYKHIANLVQSDDTLDFLREIMPCKITVKQFKEMMLKKSLKRSDSGSDESESSEDDEIIEIEDEMEEENIKEESTQSS